MTRREEEYEYRSWQSIFKYVWPRNPIVATSFNLAVPAFSDFYFSYQERVLGNYFKEMELRFSRQTCTFSCI